MEKKISLLGLVKDTKMVYLDNFLVDYEWCIFESETKKGKYNIFDLQCGYNVEENYTIEQVINRVVSRALDYEINEHYDCFFDNIEDYLGGYIDYIKGLYDIALQYKKPKSNYEEDWLIDIKKSINKMIDYWCYNKKIKEE